MAQSKRCDVCSVRPADSTTPEGKLCLPCYEEAGWENSHSDNDHEGYRSWTLRNTNYTTRKALLAGIEEVAAETTGCWVCHPELNEAQREYTQRTGSSRVGMVLNVPLRATAQDKAKIASTKLGLVDARMRTNHGVTTLKSKADDVELSWDARGRYVSGTVAGRKVRNVSDAMRAMGK